LLQPSPQAVALFNANQHNDAIMRVQELTAICPKAYTHACRVVEVSFVFCDFCRTQVRA
jgi:hypothetical protein